MKNQKNTTKLNDEIFFNKSENFKKINKNIEKNARNSKKTIIYI